MGFIKDIIQAHADKKNDFISEWYWRAKYNKLENEFQVFKETMQCDLYKKIVKDLTESLEIKRLKRTIERLNNKCNFLLEERNRLYDENKILKKKGGTSEDGKDEG
jgi:archaellum component FlaC